MKGIVLEVRGRTAAVLREDGVVVTTSQKCAVGDTIELKAEKVRFPGHTVRNIAAAAAFAVIVSGTGLYAYQNVAACSYISLDINPSMELVLNRKNRVIDVSACDEDADTVVGLLKERNIKNMELEEALKTTCEVFTEEGYMTDEGTSYLLFNISTDDDARKETLSSQVTGLFENRENVEVVATESTLDERREARDLGISTGRFKEICLMEQNSDMADTNITSQTIGKYHNMTIQDCMEAAGQIPVSGSAGPIYINNGQEQGNPAAQDKGITEPAGVGGFDTGTAAQPSPDQITAEGGNRTDTSGTDTSGLDKSGTGARGTNASGANAATPIPDGVGETSAAHSSETDTAGMKEPGERENTTTMPLQPEPEGNAPSRGSEAGSERAVPDIGARAPGGSGIKGGASGGSGFEGGASGVGMHMQ